MYVLPTTNNPPGPIKGEVYLPNIALIDVVVNALVDIELGYGLSLVML